jgi:hypothetical protein
VAGSLLKKVVQRKPGLQAARPLEYIAYDDMFRRTLTEFNKTAAKTRYTGPHPPLKDEGQSK